MELYTPKSRLLWDFEDLADKRGQFIVLDSEDLDDEEDGITQLWFVDEDCNMYLIKKKYNILSKEE